MSSYSEKHLYHGNSKNVDLSEITACAPNESNFNLHATMTPNQDKTEIL